MFEDRTKNRYDFKKLDKYARTQVLVENDKHTQNMSETEKKLFTSVKKEKITLYPKNEQSINEQPTSPNYKYLQTFDKNQTVGEAEEAFYFNNEIKTEEINTKCDANKKESLEYEFLTDLKQTDIKKEQNQEEVKHTSKKSYSFRIKLVASVYCILVALFGGWVIGNSIDIAKANNEIHNSISRTQEINADIDKILLKIKNFDNASQDSDQSVIVDMVTQTIDIAPETIIEPNEYKTESNWFDVFCNWLSNLFGGK